jgi:hypothetical protein
MVEQGVYYGGAVIASDFPKLDSSFAPVADTTPCRRYNMVQGETLIFTSSGSASHQSSSTHITF